MPFGYWMMKRERNKKRNRRVKIQRTNKLPPLPKQSQLKYLEFAIMTEEGANELGILQNTPI